MTDKIKLGLGIPAYGAQLTAEHAQMWLEIGAMLGRSERFTLGMFGFADVCPVDKARNYLLAHAMQSGCDWLFMIDDDTFVRADRSVDDADAGFFILRMISEAARLDAAIVAAPVLHRGRNEYMVYTEGPNDKPVAVTDLIRAAPGGHFGAFFPAHAVATACIAINLHKIGESMFKFTDELSEDLDFCRQIRELGGKILVDTRVRTGHMSRSMPRFTPRGLSIT